MQDVRLDVLKVPGDLASYFLLRIDSKPLKRAILEYLTYNFCHYLSTHIRREAAVPIIQRCAEPQTVFSKLREVKHASWNSRKTLCDNFWVEGQRSN